MEVRDHKVGVAELPVEGRGRQHDAGQSGDEELKEKCDAEHHGNGEADLAAPHGAQPVKDLDAGGHTYGHGGGREEGVGVGRHADGEHVVRPHAQAEEPDAQRWLPP